MEEKWYGPEEIILRPEYIKEPCIYIVTKG
jgi:hypothetical protein